MKILVINTGSSSIKYQLFDMPAGIILCSGLVERIGEGEGRISQRKAGEEQVFTENRSFANHIEAMNVVAELITDPKYGAIKQTDEIDVVGHRVVHGGEKFAKTTFVDEDVKKILLDLSGLAPLHNPPNLVGIEVAENVFMSAKQVAVFDTAFHQTIPEEAFRYAIPEQMYQDHGIRVYGFHGTSHRYVTKQAARFLGKPLEDVNLITIHLGNGASIAAIRNGQSVDTSLGLTPMSGLVMGTRSGDIDPGVIFYMAESLKLTVREIKDILNKESGIKGLTGNNDLRNVQQRAENGDKQAQLGLKIYAYRIKKYIGSYMAVLGRVDALVFTAGVGENSALIRSLSVEGLKPFGIQIDHDLNAKGGGERDISSTNSAIRILVIPTNEELEIARQANNLMES